MAQYQAHAVSVNGHTVSVATNVEIRRISDANVDAKTFTANGVYNASDDALDGYNPVTVDIPNGSYGTPTWQHAISQGSRLLIHPTFSGFEDGYMASAPNINDTLTLETQTVTPSDSQQVVSPTDLNHYLQRVTVNPITYSSSDEGKVVSNGALTAQTSRTVTENGTYDTTLNDEVVVNVSGGGGITPEQISMRQITGSIDLGASTAVNDYAFYQQANITGVTGSSVTGSIGPNAFRGCTSLEEVDMPYATIIDAHAFRGCTALTTVDFSNVTRIGTTAASKTDEYVFNGSKISTLYLPNLLTAHGYYTLSGIGTAQHKCTLVLPKLVSVSTSNDNNMFRNGHFSAADFGPDYAYITDASFYGGSIAVLILRRTESVVGVYNSGAIQNINSNTEVYVPSALIEDYKAATLWSSKPVSIWHSLEGSPYEHYYANGVAVEE